MTEFIFEPDIINREDNRIRQSRLFPVKYDSGTGWETTETKEFLSTKECEDIIEWGNKQEMDPGTTVGTNNNYRIVDTCKIPDDKFGWLYDRLAKEILIINEMNYKYDLIGMLESINLLRYVVKKDVKGKYDWHIDCGGKTLKMRKISAVVQLNDGNEYNGCELQFSNGGDPVPCNAKSQGDLITFPSWKNHRITEIISGERYSLICWISGPPFR